MSFEGKFVGFEKQMTAAMNEMTKETAADFMVWNNLASIKWKDRIGRLLCLNLDCAGVTDYHFAKVLERNESNPLLTELCLWKGLTLTDRTFENLA